jgi:hypothetical protein
MLTVQSRPFILTINPSYSGLIFEKLGIVNAIRSDTFTLLCVFPINIIKHKIISALFLYIRFGGQDSKQSIRRPFKIYVKYLVTLMRLCCKKGQQKRLPYSELSREKGQVMSHHDRDAEIAAFIRTKGVTRCPTACVVPTQGSPSLADQAALAEYAVAREQSLRTKIATGWQVFGSLRVRN